MTWLAELILGVVIAPLGCAVGCKSARGSLRSPVFFACWCGWASAMALYEAVTGAPWWAAGDGVSALVALILWWWSRRKRKRAAKVIGAKARALRDKLVKSMPRWEPRLQPQGATA